jgi:ankyrin repeat protein
MQAASAGNVGLVRVILQLGIGVSVQADDGSTALHCAARANQVEMIHLLVGWGARSDILNNKGRTPLHEAVSARCISVFNVLVERTADITKHVLCETIKTSQHELFRQAWEGCDKDTIGNISRDLFDVAANSTQTSSMSTVLLLADIAPEWIAENGRAIIIRIISKGQTAMLEFLLASKKLDPNMSIFRDRIGSLIHLAAAKGQSEIVGLLLQSKTIDPNLATRNAVSALAIATLRGHFSIVEKLLAYPGIIVQSRTPGSEQRTAPLHIACRRGYVEIVRLILETFDERGLDVDSYAKSNTTMTPFQAAVFGGHTDVVKLLLLRQDVDVNQPLKSLATSPCQLAVRRGHARTLDVLLGDGRTDRKNVKNSRDSLLFEAVMKKRWLLVNILLDYDEASPHVTQRNLYTRTKVAVNRIDTLERLLVDTAFREHQTKNKAANLWHQAALDNDLELAMLLLEHAQRNGRVDHPIADVNRKTGDGQTPLHFAVNFGNIGVVELLLHHKDIDIDTISQRRTHEPGQSAVQMAITKPKQWYYWRKEEYAYIVDLLLAHDAQNVSQERGDHVSNLILPPLLEQAGDQKDLVLPPLFGHRKHQEYHSAGQNGDLSQKTHASRASVVGFQSNGAETEETNSEDENMVGDMIPMDMDDSIEEDPDAVFKELTHLDDEEEMSDYNGLGMLDQGTFRESLSEFTSFSEERNM